MTSIDKIAIFWTVVIVATSIGIVGYQQSSVLVTTQSNEPMTKISKQSERELVQEITFNAIKLYDGIGEDAFNQINTDAEFRTDELYVFVLDRQGFRVAHGGNPDLVGLQIPNYPNNMIRDIILDAADESGAWIQYQRALPDSHIVHTKHSYIIEHDGLIFGSGYYLEDKIATEKRSSAQYMVEQAIADYNANDVYAFSNFNSNPKYHDGELYVFVVRMSDNEFVAHGISPKIIGTKDIDIVDASGVNVGELFINNVTHDGVWVQYQWENPVNNKIEQKTSWIKLHDGYLFGVGIYE